MSEIKVNSIKGVGASTAAITVNNTDGTCTANLTNRTNKRITINGDMKISQRGTSSTVDGYGTIDRFRSNLAGCDENPTQSQSDVASGTTPYTLGFRKAFKFTNGNQTSGAGTTDCVAILHRIEAQDIASSGWNYTDSNSKITLSFWCKSSVAQNFFGFFRTQDGTAQLNAFETGSLTADTWTKVTKTISGNSNLTFNNDNGQGLILVFNAFRGTDTTGSVSLNAWGAYNSSNRVPDMTSTWYTTNDATFEITGVQLEVGSVATDFEHRSFAQELVLCQRYCQTFNGDGSQGGDTQLVISENGTLYNASNFFCSVPLKVSMRTKPSISVTTGTNYYVFYSNNAGVDVTGSSIVMNGNSSTDSVVFNHSGTTLGTSGHAILFRINNASAKITVQCEL